MRITLRYFDGCPNWETTLERLQQGLAKTKLADRAELVLERVSSEEDLERLRFRGSPTILIDDVDPFADELAPFGLSCRVYATEGRLEGSPSLQQLREVLTAPDQGS